MTRIYIFDDDLEKLEELSEKTGESIENLISDLLADLDEDEFVESYY